MSTIENTNGMGKFCYLTLIIDHEELDFNGYEFEGEEIDLEETGCEQSLFRMDVDKETKEIRVYSAYSQDFDLMEEVTHYFNTEELYNDILEYLKTNEVDNQGEVFVKYLQYLEEGYDCDKAVYLAYDYGN